MKKMMLCAAAALSLSTLSAVPAAAAPLSAPLAFKSAETQSVETVRWRGRHHGRWIGPAAGFAAGVAIGSAFAPRYYYDYGYDSYAYAPGYAPRYRSYQYGSRYCTGEDSVDSAYPSWMCSGRR